MTLGLLVSCDHDPVLTPKKRMYPRLELPDAVYNRADIQTCPFSWALPVGTEIGLQTDQGGNRCWFDVHWPALNATLHCSYYPIDEDHSLSSLVDDAYEMVSKHNVKAYFREEDPITNAEHNGLLFSIAGPVASPHQFFITDENNHFLRGSLYFDKKVVSDSVAPIVDYLRSDMDQMLSSLTFK
ncbi:MAG: hypothetical protein AAFQ02_09825 [Bacteroidota bacterium]